MFFGYSYKTRGIFALVLSLSLLLSNDIFSGTIVMEGLYQRKNIYVQNAIAGSGVGYCTFEVTINGVVSTDEINSNAFEIDLSNFQLKLGQPIMVKIHYKDDDCMPKVINPDALHPYPTFNTQDIHINKFGLLTWKTTSEKSSLPYIIEQFKWNKWVKVGEVVGIGASGLHKYSFQTTPIAGTNKFRVKQKGYMGKTRYSPSVSFISLQSELTYIINRQKQFVEFSDRTFYEVYNQFGDIVKKGYGNKFDISNLKKETYYMNYGNTKAEFKKK